MYLRTRHAIAALMSYSYSLIYPEEQYVVPSTSNIVPSLSPCDEAKAADEVVVVVLPCLRDGFFSAADIDMRGMTGSVSLKEPPGVGSQECV